ncbi:MAG: DNA polymerase Y family protein [Pseudomonadota bacterium]
MLCNAKAASAGVRIGMALSAAHALTELVVLERDLTAEHRALEKLCAWAMQFSPRVITVGDDGVALEIKGSLKLFSGLDGLLNQMKRGIRSVGYRAEFAVAPTPLAAQFLAQARQRTIVEKQTDIMKSVAELNVHVMPLTQAQHDALKSIGVRTIGECLRLPRAGLSRRLSPAFIKLLDQLTGREADPRTPYELPKCFESSLELPWQVTNSLALATACERLLHELAGFLRAGCLQTRRLHWRLINGEKRGEQRMQSFRLACSEPQHQPEHFLTLLREQLSKLTLEAPVCGIEIFANEFTRVATSGLTDLFERTPLARRESEALFFDRLSSRYGDRAIHGLTVNSDHRPERSWRAESPLKKGAPPVVDNAHLSPHERRDPKPLWLTNQPIPLPAKKERPYFKGPLSISKQRQRIESGWWEDTPIARDYYMAKTRMGSRVWVYRELEKKQWFLHGFFD